MSSRLRKIINTIVFGAIGLVLLSGLLVIFNLRGGPRTNKELILADTEFKVAIADTRVERFRGLSQYRRIGTKQGMWFVFDSPDKYGFVMRDMDFPIDIVWFNSDKKVIGTTKNATPDSYPETIYKPPSPVQYVLELAAGSVDEFGIKPGQIAEGPN